MAYPRHSRTFASLLRGLKWQRPALRGAGALRALLPWRALTAALMIDLLLFGAGAPLMAARILPTRSALALIPGEVPPSKESRPVRSQAIQAAATVTVSVSPSTATMTVSTSKTFTATVTGVTPTTVTWSATGGTISTSGSYTAPSTAGTYTVKATSTASTSSSGTATVTVVAAPVTTITATTPVTAGATSLTASVPSQSGSTYAWTITGGTITAGSTANAITYTAGAAGTLTLSCKVTNAAGTAATGTKSVTVVAAPTISSFTAAASTITSGTSTTITGTFANGTGSVNNSVGTVTSGTAKSVTPAATTTYMLTVTNTAGTAATAATTVTVVPAPVTTITAPSSATTGATGLIASVPAQSGSTYAWTASGGTITAGATTNQATFTAGAVGTLTLSCKVTNSIGTAATGTKSVSVVAAPSIASFTSAAATITAGSSTTLTGTFSNGTGSVDNGVGTVTSGTAKTVSPSATTTYTLTVTNTASTSTSATRTVTVVAAPNTTITAPSTVTASTGGWTASVPAQSGATYLWTLSKGTVTAGSGTNAITFTAGSTGSFTLSCKVTNAAGTAATGTKTLTAVAAPSISSFTSDLPGVAPGGTANLTPTFSNGTGSVSPTVGAVTSGTSVAVTPSTTTTYTLTVTNAAGTTVTATLTITVAPPPNATITVPSVVTSGQLGFKASVPAQAGCTYWWTLTNGTVVSGFNSAGGTFGPAISFRPGTAGTPLNIQVNVSNGISSATSTLNLTVLAPPATTVTTAPLVQAGAQGLTASVPAVAGSSYQWTIQGGTLTSSATAASITYTAPASGGCALTCVVTNGAGTQDQGTAKVSVLQQAGDLSGVYTQAYSTNTYVLVQNGGSFFGWGNTVVPTTSPTLPQLKRSTLLAAVGPVNTSLLSSGADYNYCTLSGTVSNGSLQGVASIGGQSQGSFTGSLSADGLTLTIGGTNYARNPGSIAVAFPQTELVLAPGAQIQLSPAVIGTTNAQVSWETLGAPGEVVTSGGLYSASSQTGVYAVTARSLADPRASATVLVHVVANGVLSVASWFSYTATGAVNRLFQTGNQVQGQRGTATTYSGTLNGVNWDGTWQEGASNGTFDFSFAADSPQQRFLLTQLSTSSSFGALCTASDTNSDPANWPANMGWEMNLTPGDGNQARVNWSATAGQVVSLPDGKAFFAFPTKPGLSFVLAQSQSEPTVVSALPILSVPDLSDAPLNGVYSTSAGELDIYPPMMNGVGLGQLQWVNSPLGAVTLTVTSGTLPVLSGTWTTSTQQGTFELDFNSTYTAFQGYWKVNNGATQDWQGTYQPGQVRVQLSVPYQPTFTTLNTGGVVPLCANVAGGTNQDVQWTVTGGQIGSSGIYTAPATAGSYTVKATCHADSTQSASLTFTVVDHPLVNLTGTYSYQGAWTTTLIQDGLTVWIGSTRYQLNGLFLEDDALNLMSVAADGSSYSNGNYVRTTPTTDVVKFTPVYYSTPLGQTLKLKAVATGTPTYSATYGTVASDGTYTPPAFPARDTVTATQGASVAKAMVDVMDTGAVDAEGSYTLAGSTGTQLTLTPNGSSLQGSFTGDGVDTKPVALSGILQGSTWTGTWNIANVNPPLGGSFTGAFGPRGDSLQLWLVAGNGPLSANYIFTRIVQAMVQPQSSTLLPGMNELFLSKVIGQVDQSVVWSSTTGNPSSITAAGVFTAPSTLGMYTVKATPAHGTPSIPGQASVNVVSPFPMQVAPSYVQVRPGTSSAFQAWSAFQGWSPANASGALGSVPLPVTWSVIETNGGSVTAGGVYTAPAVQGTYHVMATSTTDTTQTCTATIQVTTAAPVAVTVVPGSITLNKSGAATFVAQVQGAANPAVSWSCSGGAIDPNSGAYTAPAAFGTYTIRATSVEDGTAYGVATVTVQALAGTDGAMTYDANGNLVSDGSRTFEWDGENRMTAVTILATGHRTEFTYDGLGRRVAFKEIEAGSTSGAVTAYLWEKHQIVESRSADGSLTLQRYYAQGFVDSDGTNLYYTRDHLGSVRELTDGIQSIRARYDYDPYGRVTKIQGDKDSLFAYAGYFQHPQSGLDLTQFRAYDPNLGRWISRDPINESGGIDMYAYGFNSPITKIDPTGLEPEPIPEPLLYTPTEDEFYTPPQDWGEFGQSPQEYGNTQVIKESRLMTCVLKKMLKLYGALALGGGGFSGGAVGLLVAGGGVFNSLAEGLSGRSAGEAALGLGSIFFGGVQEGVNQSGAAGSAEAVAAGALSDGLGIAGVLFTLDDFRDAVKNCHCDYEAPVPGYGL